MLVWISRIMILVIGILILIAISKIQRLIYLEKRIKKYCVVDEKDDISIMDKFDAKYHSVISKYEKNKQLQKHSSNYQKYVVLGEDINPVRFLIYKLLIGFGFTALVIVSSLFYGKIVSFFGIIFNFVFEYYLFDLYLFYSTRSKKKKIKNDMLRAVILLNNSFKAGKSVLQAVSIASKELPKPIASEFGRIYQDMVYGLSADVAFMRFAKRVELEEASYVSSSLSILNKTGGNIVSVFNTIEKTLFDRKKLENDLKSSAAASNFVVKFLMVIPLVFALLIYVISPTYFDPFFSSGLGYFLLFIMFIMFVMYIYLLDKIMKVKV